jgi:hypothetical protein
VGEEGREVAVASRCVESEVVKRVGGLGDEVAVGSCMLAAPESEDVVEAGHVTEEETAGIEVAAMAAGAWEEQPEGCRWEGWAHRRSHSAEDWARDGVVAALGSSLFFESCFLSPVLSRWAEESGGGTCHWAWAGRPRPDEGV